MTKMQKIKIQTREMKYLKRVRRITKEDRLRNYRIRHDLQVEHILLYIEQGQLNWCGVIQTECVAVTDEETSESQDKDKGEKRKIKGYVGNIVGTNLKKGGKNWMRRRSWREIKSSGRHCDNGKTFLF